MIQTSPNFLVHQRKRDPSLGAARKLRRWRNFRQDVWTHHGACKRRCLRLASGKGVYRGMPEKEGTSGLRASNNESSRSPLDFLFHTAGRRFAFVAHRPFESLDLWPAIKESARFPSLLACRRRRRRATIDGSRWLVESSLWIFSLQNHAINRKFLFQYLYQCSWFNSTKLNKFYYILFLIQREMGDFPFNAGEQIARFRIKRESVAA